MGDAMKTARVICAVGLLLATAASVTAQSLAEVARKEEERRKAVKTPSRTYTIDDLKPYGRVQVAPPVPATPAAPAGAGGAAATTAAAAAAGQPAAEPEAEKDEAYWRKSFGDVRSKLETRRAMLQAVDGRVQTLATDPSIIDPALRGTLDRERTRLVTEADKLRQEVAELTRALAALEDEARRTNVPVGWIR